jgi:hypothetical protein
MSGGGPEFVVLIIMISTFGWVANTWIRARHGYPVENEWSGLAHKQDSPESLRHVELLTSENAGLKAQMARLEDRIGVLEQIATDPAQRTAREIESLR